MATIAGNLLLKWFGEKSPLYTQTSKSISIRTANILYLFIYF